MDSEEIEMTSADPVYLDTRLAGQLKRYHVWPHIQPQTVASHSWNLLRIYFSITHQPDEHVVYHMIFHDIGEISTGDLPYPVKKDNPMLKEQVDLIEQKSYYRQLQYWNAYQPVVLTEEDKILVKQIELIEMAEWGMDEMNLGNSHGFIVADRCLRALYDQEPSPPVVRYVIIRIRLFFAQQRFTLMPPLSDWWHTNGWEEKHGSE
jgi:5'-deoxynucleotidase YfbR-like HD superfamily hydrolase